MQTTVTKWMDETADKMPDQLALSDECQSMTYRQYREKSLGMAAKIIEVVDAKKPIVVYLEKSIKVLVSFMGIAYSGNFYTPIDIEMPEERIRKILQILQPELVITSVALKDEFVSRGGYSGNILLYEDVTDVADSASVRKRTEKVIDTDILYVLFTSGSTGIPKGVCITHRGVIDYIDTISEIFHISSADVFGNQAPFYFDNSILDIYASMKNGSTLYIIPPKLFSEPILLLEFLRTNGINTIFWVPSALMVVSRLNVLKDVDLRGVLKRVLFCGEVMPNKQLNIWRHYLPDVIYANLYGPTEITDACAYFIVDREFKDDEPLPIGFPMKNMELLVLDENDNLVKMPNVEGELCVRGTGLAKGYYKEPERTAKVFVTNPLTPEIEDIIYRTGDIVRYNERGELVYLSRKDFQIKHMGHRIELGEIEVAASAMEGVTMCCCLYNTKKAQIILFLDSEIKRETVNKFLEKKIPKYMLPRKVVYLKSFPINANGKIDRVALMEML